MSLCILATTTDSVGLRQYGLEESVLGSLRSLWLEKQYYLIVSNSCHPQYESVKLVKSRHHTCSTPKTSLRTRVRAPVLQCMQHAPCAFWTAKAISRDDTFLQSQSHARCFRHLTRYAFPILVAPIVDPWNGPPACLVGDVATSNLANSSPDTQANSNRAESVNADEGRKASVAQQRADGVRGYSSTAGYCGTETSPLRT